jgi:hypothetical protein
MRSTVRIVFGNDEVVVNLAEAAGHWSAEEARQWLDRQFVANGCEPLRASGKVLTADKLLAIADAIGRQGFEGDPALRQDFALAAEAALSRPMVRVDVDQRSITF